MSNAVSVLGGAGFSGIIRVVDAGVTGMITLRGDLACPKIAGAVKATVGVNLPQARNITQNGHNGAGWMSSDELLLTCPYEEACTKVEKLEEALKGEYFLVADVSDARARFTLTGAAVREVLAKGSPADLSPGAWPVGELRRTRLGQVAVAFWLRDDITAELVCFRSLGKFVWDWLNVTAGDDVPGYF
ncbi:MAG: sarcosine oxidase subunit gamma [Rhodobacteraceae bacterium]|nr:sarcosine oxidase subunit gamma [Paracoccaceae bacterium]